jgi:hypothetical protein
MFKRLFQGSNGIGTVVAPEAAQRKESEFGGPSGNADDFRAERPSPVTHSPVSTAAKVPAPAKPSGFEDIYQNAALRVGAMDYSILKVAEMVASPHLVGLSAESRRGAVLMALEVAGAKVEDLLQDAILRQRALDEQEDAQRQKLQAFEAAKASENSNVQAEMDRLTAQFMSRIQANLDEVAREQDSFQAWQKRKKHESDRIAEAAAACVPFDNSMKTNLPASLERAATGRRMSSL